ncbi:MAG: carboxypeptidase-like regulatory domain-containing protein [Acidobacteriota bacterium]
MRQTAVVLSLATILGLVANAQAPAAAQGQAPEPPKKARVEGIVTSLAGEPLARVQVRLAGQISVTNGQIVQPTAYSATSDDAGKFVIENIEPGKNFQLTATRTGFVTARYGARSANSPAVPLSLDAGQVMKGVQLVMTPQAVISGRVTDPNGDPIQNAQVSLMRRGYQRGARQLVTAGNGNTNDQGDYRVANLMPGRYYLMVQSRNLAGPSGGAAPATAPIPTYYPNGTDPQSAAPLDLAAGQELRGLDVRLRQGKVYTLRGKALTTNGAPAVNARVLAMPKADEGNPLAAVQALLGSLTGANPTKPDGTFEIRGVSPGTYTLQSLSIDTGATRTAGRMEVRVIDADVADLVLSVVPGPAVTGTVRLEEGDLKALLPAGDPNTSAQANTLNVSAANAGIQVTGARIAVGLNELTPLPIGGNPPATIKDDGTFVLEGVSPGKYQLTVAALPQNMYVKSARLGGTDVTRNGVDLTSGAGGSLEIVLSNKAADVTGAVRGEKGDSMVGVQVTLWTREAEPGTNANGVKVATSDSTGGFSFKGLRPGIYYLAAWEDIDSGLSQARDFLTQFNNEVTKLELAESAHSAAEVKVVPSAKIKIAEEKLP